MRGLELNDLYIFFSHACHSKFEIICNQRLLQLSSMCEEVTLIPIHVSCKPRWHMNIKTKWKWGNCMFSELCMHHNCTTIELEGRREKVPQSNWSRLARIPQKCNRAYKLGSRQENIGKHPKILEDPMTILEHAMQKLARSAFKPTRLVDKARSTVAKETN